MAADLLEHGGEGRRARPRPRVVAVVLTALAVVGAGLLWAERGQDGPAPALLDRAAVLSVRDTPSGVLHVRVEVEGVPRAQLASVDVDLPGGGAVLLPAPGRLTDDGTGLLVVDLLPRCPDALTGLSQAAVSAVVRGPEGAPGRRVRVALDTSGDLSDAVQERCGTVDGVPGLRTSPVALEGPAGQPLRTRVDLSAAISQPVTVVGVRPGPGLETAVRTALPMTLSPGGAPSRLLVDLRLGGCGGSPDTPPYLLVLAGGETVATSVAPEVSAPLAALRPYQCAG